MVNVNNDQLTAATVELVEHGGLPNILDGKQNSQERHLASKTKTEKQSIRQRYRLTANIRRQNGCEKTADVN